MNSLPSSESSAAFRGASPSKIFSALASSGLAPASELTKPAILWPAEIYRNHAPMTMPTIFFGASFVTAERPTGDRHSSPVVCSR